MQDMHGAKAIRGRHLAKPIFCDQAKKWKKLFFTRVQIMHNQKKEGVYERLPLRTICEKKAYST
jgi:hypothetical protein